MDKRENYLNKLINYNGIVMNIRVYLGKLKSEGYLPVVTEVPKYQYNRRKYNNMDHREQEIYEQKLLERKVEYRAVLGSFYVLSKIEYDYFVSLFLPQLYHKNYSSL